MDRTFARRAGPALSAGRRLGIVLALAALVASPLVGGVLGARGNATSGNSTAPPRSLEAIEASPYVAAPYSEPGLDIPGAIETGTAVPGNLSIVVTLPYSNGSTLNAFLAALGDPSSPAYQRYLTASEFDAEFAPAASTYSAAVAYFVSLGARDISTYADRATISFTATASDAGQMFHTAIDSWVADGQPYYAPTSTVELPASLAASISDVVGLSSYGDGSIQAASLPTTSDGGVSAAATLAATPPGYLAPVEVAGQQLEYATDLQVAYDEQSLFNENGYPTGSVIATILWQGYYNGSVPLTTPYGVLEPHDPVGAFVPSDISAYFNETSPPGQPHAEAYGVPVGGATASGPLASYDTTDANLENTIDLEMAGSLAPGATLFDVYGTYPAYPELDTAFAFILNPNASYPGLAGVSVISNSWADQDGLHPEWNQYLEEAAARGITVLASTGDSGDYPDSPWQSGNPPGVNTTFPSSLATDAYGVVGVGGTTITLNAALHVNSTEVWNVPSAQEGTTSGVSPFYPEPSWQRASSADELIGGLGRGIPDISAIANNMLITISDDGIQFNATNATYGGAYRQVTGTSISSPVEAGIVAEIDHVLGSEGSPWVGYLLPDLYRLANEEYGPLVTTPTTGYLNNSGYTSPLPTLPLSDTIEGSNHYYAARAGFDLVTGWGSLDAYNVTMYFLTASSTGVYGRLSGVEDNLSLDGLSVTSHGAESYFNASIQQNLFLANSLGAPVDWIQNVIYLNWTASGWAVNDTGWVVYPFYGLYSGLEVYEYNYPLAGEIVSLPNDFDIRTVLDPGTGFDNQTIDYYVGSSELSLPAPGASYIIGSLWYNFSWQGKEYENGPYPPNPTPGGLSPQLSLVGGPSGGVGDFAAPTSGTLQAEVEPFASGEFELADSRTFGNGIDQTGESAQNLQWSSTGAVGSWTLGTSAGSGTQGILSYQPTAEYSVNFTETGLPAGSLWFVNISHGESYSSTGATISVQLPPGRFSYNVSSEDRTWGPTVPNGTLTITNASRSVLVPFERLPWTVAFQESGLPAGTLWNVTLDSSGTSATTGSTITFNLANGTYFFRVRSSDPRWTAQPQNGTVVVDGANQPVHLAFVEGEFTISFVAQGLPTGATWYVNVSGGASYRSTNSTISFRAPNGTYAFTIGAPLGQTASPFMGTVVVAGTNVSRGISFASSSSGAGTIPGWLWWTVGIVAIAAVAGATYAVVRRRAAPPKG